MRVKMFYYVYGLVCEVVVEEYRVFFFKQKTAYEMRISDWSSDVCSSDLPRIGPFQARLDTLLVENEVRGRRERLRMTRIHDLLEREGFEGSYDAVRRYAARWKAERRKDDGDGDRTRTRLNYSH